MNEDIILNKPAPQFKLPDKDKNMVDSNNFRGTWVVVYFYPKDNTQGCTLEAIDFTKSIREFNNYNAVVVGISPDSPESHCRFYDKHNLNLILLSDTDHKVAKEYGVWKKKSMYGKSFMGIERSTFLIDPEGRVRAVWRKVKVPGHVEEVLQTLKSFQ
ncbi:MAG TPA: thioredoxin-dependent thiol peroxidase [Spirochaetota bacterium]|nr:thioredoxin-dependent thiol peroxidase [Spirochaetota bacterium]HPP50911.1 thioredoxin-dependent thiol peroxidase [Spirochaetota bacterium]